MKPRIFVTRPLPQPVMDRLASRCELSFYPHDRPMTTEELLEACREVEGLVVCGSRLEEPVIREARNLRIVSNVSVGYDNIDVAACTARRIPVTNAAGTIEESTADLAFALLLAVARRLVEGDRYVREGRWHAWQFNLLWGADVHRKTLGLYGFGHIGQAVARRARGFSMRILYHSRRRAPEALEHELRATYADRDTLFRESDFVSLHVPLTPETEHLIGEREFELMKPSAFLINTSRGRVVNEKALVSALMACRIAGAGLDVFEHEPQVSPELVAMNNVVLLPHIGSATAETRLRMAHHAAEKLLAFFDGHRPENVVNPEVYA